MGSTSPTQACTACPTSDVSVVPGPFALTLVERLLPKPGFSSEDERTRHHADAARSHRADESTTSVGAYPG